MSKSTNSYAEDMEISWPEWRKYLDKPAHDLHTLMNPQTVSSCRVHIIAQQRHGVYILLAEAGSVPKPTCHGVSYSGDR